MEYDAIYNRFVLLSGLYTDQACQWSYIVEDSMIEIRNMLRPDCDMEIHCRRLHAVAAALAFYRYRCVLAARGGAVDFKAGDVSIKSGGEDIKNAFAMYQEQLRGIDDLLKKNDFVFGRTDSICTKN